MEVQRACTVASVVDDVISFSCDLLSLYVSPEGAVIAPLSSTFVLMAESRKVIYPIFFEVGFR